MSESRQPRIVEAVWPWRERGTADSQSPPAGRRRRALLQAAITLAIGLLLLLVLHRIWIGRIVIGIGTIVFLSGMFAPRIFSAIEGVGRLLGKGAAAGLTWLLLVPFFYTVFFGGRLCLKLMKRDPLRRKCPTDEETYWVNRPPARGPEFYRRQY